MKINFEKIPKFEEIKGDFNRLSPYILEKESE
jgi:hypothetical protein